MPRFDFVQAVFFSVIYARRNSAEFVKVALYSAALVLVPVLAGFAVQLAYGTLSPGAGAIWIAIIILMVAIALFIPTRIGLLWLQALTGELPEKIRLLELGGSFWRLAATLILVNFILNIAFWPLEFLSGGDTISFIFLPVLVWLLTMFASVGAISVRRERIAVFEGFSVVKGSQISACLVVAVNLAIILAVGFALSGLAQITGLRQLIAIWPTVSQILSIPVIVLGGFFLPGPGCYFLWLRDARDEAASD